MTPQEAEEYVRAHWCRVTDPILSVLSTTVTGTQLDPQAWLSAADFTREHEEKIRQKREEIKLAKMILDVDWVRCEWLADAERILAGLESQLADFLIRWKEQENSK